MKRTKKLAVTILIIVYLLGIIPRQAVMAEEVPPDSQTDQSQSQSDQSQSQSTEPSPDPSPLPSSEPSASPDPCASDCPPAEVDQTNDAEVDNEVTDVADTGNNTITEPSPSPEPEVSPEATGSATPDSSTSEESSSTTLGTSEPTSEESNGTSIDTGDAASQVDLVTVANTNLINAEITYHIENIYIDENGNIDLTKSESFEVQSSANLEITQENEAVINNVVTAIANTGANTIDGSSGDITTGTATVVVNIFNFINANFVNSVWQFVVINIFGDVDGDIILPELGQENLSLLGTVSGDISQANSAQVANTIDASANTGENQVSNSGSVETGDAVSVVNNQNFVNFNLFGGAYYMLLVNNFGNWNGQFLGWGNLSSATPVWGQMLFTPYFNLSVDENGTLVAGSQTNNAVLNNQITASANTGGNLIDGNGQITSGNAYSVVNLINFVNTNIINSVGFFGIINIFGSLNGDIGGESFFATTESTETAAAQNQAQEEVRVAGGQLETSMSSNVGTHVNPGDTVTFFITARNPGSGPVYDAKVYFNLYDSNGEIGTIQFFDLGKLNPGQTAHISFGVVLADTAPKGLYEVLVEAQGKVGPDNQEISSQSETSFMVGTSAFGSFISSVGNSGDVQAASTAAGGGNTEIGGAQSANYWWWIYTVFGTIGMAYVLYRLSRLSPKYYQLLAAYGRKRKIYRVSAVFSKFASKAMAFKSWFF